MTNSKSQTIAVIPARGGSKRLPGKNIKNLGDLPLIAHSIEYALKSNRIDEVYVSTDDWEIKKVAENYGAKVIDRPKELSGDHEPTVSALKHVLETLQSSVQTVVLLQATNPLRPINLLEEAFAIFQENELESLFTVTRNEQKFGKIENHQFVPYNYTPGQRSQDLDPLYFENGLLYISNAELIRNNTIISEQAYPFVVDHPFAKVDIDTEEDFEYASFLLQKLKTS